MCSKGVKVQWCSSKLVFGVEMKPVWSSPLWELSATLASYPPRSPWTAALTSAVLLWLRKNKAEGKKKSQFEVLQMYDRVMVKYIQSL